MKRRKLDFTTAAAASNDVDRLRRGGYSRQGAWDLGQICDHLHKAAAASMDGYSGRGPWFIRMLAPVARWRTFRSRSVPVGFKAPASVMPSPDLDESQAVAAFKATLARAFDPRAVFQKHPLMGNLTADQNRQLHLIHAGHHLSFLIPSDRIEV